MVRKGGVVGRAKVRIIARLGKHSKSPLTRLAPAGPSSRTKIQMIFSQNKITGNFLEFMAKAGGGRVFRKRHEL